MDWTGKVDAKAAFSFGIQSALLAAVVTLVAGNKLFDRLSGWWIALFLAALVLVGIGAFLAALVVAPILRSANLKKESKSDSIYFGHVRFLSALELERRLRTRDPLPQLSRQIVRASKIAWTKHVRVQWSIWLGVSGGFVLVICGLLVASGVIGSPSAP
jgi:hypothetical protein